MVYITIWFNLTCYEFCLRKLGKYNFFCHFFKFNYSYWPNLIKNYKISDDILKALYLVKRLIFRLIKWNKTYRSYNLKSTTIVLYFLYTSSDQMSFLFKNFQKFWGMLIIYHKMCQFHVCMATRSRLTFVFAQN